MNPSHHNEIEALMARYFDGLYHCDSAVLRTVFHRHLSYVNANPGHQEFLGLDAYMERIESRTPPAAHNDERLDKIERIDLKNQAMGIVEARMTMMGRSYQDLLTIIRTDGEWQVLNKVFTYKELEC